MSLLQRASRHSCSRLLINLQSGSATARLSRLLLKAERAQSESDHWDGSRLFSLRPLRGCTSRRARIGKERAYADYFAPILTPTKPSGEFPRLMRSRTLERPDRRAASTEATTCAGEVTG